MREWDTTVVNPMRGFNDLAAFAPGPHPAFMSDIVRGQIIFRRAVGEHSLGRMSDLLTGSRADSHQFVFDIGLALIECAPGSYADEELLDLLVTGSADDFELSLSRRGKPMPQSAKVNNLSGLLTDLRIEPPFLGSLLCCGGMILRRTRFPASSGAEVMAGVAIIRSPVEVLPESEMFTLMGVPGHRLSMASPEEMPDAFTEGSTPEQAFSKPIWGFGQRRGIYSTLHLDVIDAGKEYVPLMMTENPTDEQRHRMAELEATGLVDPFHSRSWHGEYMAFKKRIFERGAMPAFDGYPTRDELDCQRAVIKDIVMEMKREARAQYAPGMA